MDDSNGASPLRQQTSATQAATLELMAVAAAASGAPPAGAATISVAQAGQPPQQQLVSIAQVDPQMMQLAAAAAAGADARSVLSTIEPLDVGGATAVVTVPAGGHAASTTVADLVFQAVDSSSIIVAQDPDAEEGVDPTAAPGEDAPAVIAVPNNSTSASWGLVPSAASSPSAAGGGASVTEAAAEEEVDAAQSPSPK